MKKPVTKAAPKKLAKPITKAKAAIKKAKPVAAVKKAVKVAAKKPTKVPVKKVSKSSKAPAKKAVSKVVKPIAKNAKANAKSVKPAPKLTAKELAKKAAEEKALKKAQEKAAKEQAKAEAKAAKLKAKEAAVELDENGQPIKKTRGRKPKAEVVTEPGVDNRTDRQKARDRKAKEKALLKEFAAQQLGSEEQQELRRSRLKTLIKMGKSKGYLTHGEMNDVMSDELSEVDALETLIGLLNDIGITVYEQAPDAETLLLNEHGPTATSEEEAEEEAEAALSTVDSEFGRTTDPVRMYMREMGTVDLLTREGEIVIAKKIEAGLKDMVMALSACPVTISEILANVDKIVSGEMEIDQFVDGLVDPNAEDIPMAADEPEDLELMEEGEEGDDEEGGGGGASTASAKQLEELKQRSLEKFAVIRAQFDKMRRAHDRDGYNSPGYLKAQDAIRNELLGFRLTAKSVEKLCDTMRAQVDEV